MGYHLGSLVQTFAPQINPINSAKTQFVVSAPLPVAGSYAILINAKGLDSSIDTTNTIIFEVPQNQAITANLIISSIQSLSSGFIRVSSDTYQDSFIDQILWLISRLILMVEMRLNGVFVFI